MKDIMKRILILFAGFIFCNIVTAQTEKTEPLKKIDSLRGVQISEQRENVTTIPITTTVNGIPAAPQPNSVETRTATTGSSVNPGTPNGNLPLQQGKQTTTKASKNMREVNPNAINRKTIDTISSDVGRNRVRTGR